MSGISDLDETHAARGSAASALIVWVLLMKAQSRRDGSFVSAAALSLTNSDPGRQR